MATILNTIFKLKRGTAERWAELNPILAQGEPGFVLDANSLKIGEGVTAWNDLPYLVKSTLEEDLIDLIEEEESRAKKVEEDLTLRLAVIEEFFAEIENPDSVIDTLSEIVHYITEDKKNTESITEILTSNTKTLEDIINAESGILAQANKYTDDMLNKIATEEEAGFVKIDNSTIKMNSSKQIYVDKMSTDNLEQGSQTLVLNGGNASE